MKTAIIMIGNLGSYKLSIDSIMKNIIKPNNAEVFILTSRGKNYFHLVGEDLLHGGKNDYSVEEGDEEEIKNCFGDSLKLIKYIEDITDYKIEMKKQVALLDERVSWWDDRGRGFVHFFDKNTKKIKDGRNYLDRFLMMKYLIKMLEDYETTNNFEYDYIIRVRIDQIFKDKIIIQEPKDGEELFIMGSGMDCFWHGTPKTVKQIALNAVSEIGKFGNDSITDIGDYRFDRDMQFAEFLKRLPNTKILSAGLQLGITLFTEKTKIFIPDQATEVERKKQTKSLKEYYGFNSCEQKYPIINHHHRHIWVYTYFKKGGN